MKNQILAGAALAATMVFAQPVFAASASSTSAAAFVGADSHVGAAVDAFLARRQAPLWTDAGGRPNPAALRLLAALDRAELDGLSSGPLLAARARGLLAGGGAENARTAERLLSTALVLYAQAVRSTPAGMDFANSWVAPPATDPARLLATAAAAPSLDRFVEKLAQVNPVYAELREAAFANMRAGIAPDARVRASLERARLAPVQSRYVMVDSASATLYMIDDGRIADRMKVIVGKAQSATPLIASTIYHATLNPYWNVPEDLARTLIGPKVLAQGASYLVERNYDVLAGDGMATVDPAKVDWKGVVDGKVTVRLRQRPNPANSMGAMKFAFANDSQIFLHDSPNKALFASDDRQLSNGCIRLEDAPRFARWLMAGAELPAVSDPETDVALPKPVPIYVTYLTARASNGAIAFVDDKYGFDRGGQGRGFTVAGMRED